MRTLARVATIKERMAQVKGPAGHGMRLTCQAIPVHVGWIEKEGIHSSFDSLGGGDGMVCTE